MTMEFSGEYRIPAPPQTVWNALNDPAVLQACISGCKSLEKISDTEFASTVAVKVGPVSATFKGSVVLSDLDPPRGYTLSGQGQGGAAGFAKMSARVMLSGDGADTVLKYDAKADIGGKLASVGSRFVLTVAKKNADNFFSALARRLGGSGASEAAAQAAAVGVTRGGAIPAVEVGTAPSVTHWLRSSVPAWLAVAACAAGVALGYILGRMG
jgi:hypothetical protein